MEQIIHIINEMSPYLLLGFFLAGLMHAFVPGNLFHKYLAKNDFRSVLNAAILGIPLPLCSCGVIPTAMSLRKEGASKGSAVSFLIATPQTGVDSIIATYSLMGLPFAIIRPIVALVTALIGGSLVNLFDKSGTNEKQNMSAEAHHEEKHCCCCHKEEKKEEHNCCHDEEKEEEEHGCCCCHEQKHHHTGFWGKMLEALEYAFVEMMGDIGKWLIMGLVVAGIITVAIPDSFFALFADNSLLSMLLVLVMAIPMYLCATGSIPIAVALMMKGLTPGAGLVLLMAGPASNVASMLLVGKVLGHRTQIIYLLTIMAGAIGFGLGIDYLLPREWFTANLVAQDACCEEPTIFSWICTAALAIMLFNALVLKRHKCH